MSRDCKVPTTPSCSPKYRFGNIPRSCIKCTKTNDYKTFRDTLPAISSLTKLRSCAPKWTLARQKRHKPESIQTRGKPKKSSSQKSREIYDHKLSARCSVAPPCGSQQSRRKNRMQELTQILDAPKPLAKLALHDQSMLQSYGKCRRIHRKS